MSRLVAGSQRPQRTQHRGPPSRDQSHRPGFRLRAKALTDHILSAARNSDVCPHHSKGSPAQLDAQFTEVLRHFESEMKALRVMLKSKDVLVDPDNALISASRIRSPYNAMIRLCLQNNRIEQAFKLYNQMKKDGIFPGAGTYGILITGLNNAIHKITMATSTAGHVEAQSQAKQIERVREVYEELEKLWKQAFPQYFRPGRFIAISTKSKDALPLEQSDFNSLSEQARRNLVSQQASISEVRENPQVLTTALGAYGVFLGLAGLRDERQQLFDRLFPPSQIDQLAKGLAPNASPQDKLELANHKLGDCLPVGDVSTLSIFLQNTLHTKDVDRLANFEQFWSRVVKLVHIEHHQKGSGSQMHMHSSPPAAKPQSRSQAHIRAGSEQLAIGRFRPDDKLMQYMFSTLHQEADNSPSTALRLAYDIVSKIYGLDLESCADGILRDPRSNGNAETYGYERYLVASHGDESKDPVVELRNANTAFSLARVLARPASSKQSIALFNYLWARAHAENQDTKLQTESVGSMISNTTVFGTTLSPSIVLSLLWILAEIGDPLASRTLLDAMYQAAEQTQHAGQSEQDRDNRRQRRSKQAVDPLASDLAQEWKPRDVAYQRALRANLKAVLRGPDRLTAARLSEAVNEPQSSKYDAWAETKSLFCEWSDQVSTIKGQTSTPRWGVNSIEARLKTLGSRGHDNSDGQRRLAAQPQMGANGVPSLFLGIASTYASKHEDSGVQVAREALTLIESRLGIETVVKEAIGRQEETSNAKGLTESAQSPNNKTHAHRHLHRLLDLALDTSGHSFAAKEDVELWKRIKKMLPAESSEAKSGSQKPRTHSDSKDVRGKHRESNRLLLSRDDYLELEAEAEMEDEEDLGGIETGQGSRGSLRMQRRSRHVEQELERWVRGAS